MKVNWVKDTTFIIIVKDEDVANQIVDLVSWGVMNKNFSVKRWPNNLALEEIKMELVPFCMQIKGLPLNMCLETNARRLSLEVGMFMEMKNLDYARGFLRVKVEVDTMKPLVMGYWLPRECDIDSWIDFSYERL